MLSASLYIVVCSAKNHIWVRLRRLREPRYLIGALVGAAYLYFAVFMRMGGTRRATRRSRAVAGLPFVVPQDFWPAAVASGVLAGVALAWLLPSASGLFEFSEAEVQLLVPAPVSRRQLLIHRLVRSQIGLLFAAMVPALLISGQFSGSLAMGSIWTRVLRGLALWIVFVTMRVYFAGVTSARDHLLATDRRARVVAWVPLLLAFAAFATVGAPLAQSYWQHPAQSAAEAMSRFMTITASGMPRMVLAPLIVLVRPLWSDGLASYLSALLRSSAVLVAVAFWVLRSDEVYQAAGGDVPHRKAQRPQHAGAGLRARTAGWTLPLVGRTETLFAWKNAMQTLRTTNLLGALPYVLPALGFAVIGATTRMSATGARNLAVGLSMGSLMIALFCMLLGPQSMRSDLRSDLRHLELFKTWPVKSAALIRGELLWPTACLTVCAWVALACATVFSAAAFPELTQAWRLSIAVAAFLLAPVLTGAQFAVHNAAAVLFPAWVTTGAHRPRGLDMMGQRLILFAAVVIALALMVGPGVLAGGIVVFACYRFIGAVSLVPAAIACLIVVALEILLATEMLGAAYDRIDLSQVERAE